MKDILAVEEMDEATASDEALQALGKVWECRNCVSLDIREEGRLPRGLSWYDAVGHLVLSGVMFPG